MGSYVTEELRALVIANFPARAERVGIFGHPMAGHGALTPALKHPGAYQSVSAFAPIAAPMRCPWGVKAFTGYLGDNRAAWAAHDATKLVRSGARVPPLLIDQGLADKFFLEQLHPDLFETACRQSGQALTLRRHDRYDHGYYFVASFMANNLPHHAMFLNA